MYEVKGQERCPIRDALDTQGGAVARVQVETAVLINVAAPLLSLARRAVAGTDIAVIETGGRVEHPIAKPFAVFRIEQRAGYGVESRRERYILVGSELQIIGDRHKRAQGVGTPHRGP